MKTKLREHYFSFLLVLLVIITGLALSFRGRLENFERVLGEPGGGIPVAGSLEEKFNFLSQKQTNACSNQGFIASKEDDERLQGACCGAMDWHRYVEQVSGLEAFSDIAEIPADPYDIPVSLARQLLDYQQTISLSEQQQVIYDQAVEMSHEGGPCCCKCWRWFAFEGLANFLITKEKFDADQIAGVWDLEDGCGGPGHEHEYG